MLKWLLRLLPISYMILIWILSSLPHNAVVELPDSAFDRFFKESMHLVEFGILYLLLVGAAFTFKQPFTFKINLLLAALACLYGVVDEIHQYFVPYRSATLIDVVKDVIGVAVAYWVISQAVLGERFQKIGRFLESIKRVTTARK
ncbi:VanZ family protein [Cytobacillus gottheilii]|uniref:VanZ family protein n=1 Tax=Cytobacillus gottheilii TaxID=859144 RepID=A0ABX8FBA1_9BACI|nr:VanZ family protein [Cytobacillus gottheilii]QVY61360.1 VanZ family protein [Cytobacillus gottheilii]